MTAPTHGVAALVLAGARGSGDPLCVSEGVGSKAVIDIAGLPMLARVLNALGHAGLDGAVWVLGGEPDDIRAASGGRDIVPLTADASGPAASLALALDGPVTTPLLVTTADHPLLTGEIVSDFLQVARQTDADLCIGFARLPTIEARFPDTRRTYLPFGARDLSGCNLFYLANDRAVAALRFWGGVEQHRKHPWQIARRLGLGFLLRLLLRRSDGAAVFDLLSRRVGAKVHPVILPHAEAAVDVDSVADLEMVRDLISGREATTSQP